MAMNLFAAEQIDRASCGDCMLLKESWVLDRWSSSIIVVLVEACWLFFLVEASLIAFFFYCWVVVVEVNAVQLQFAYSESKNLDDMAQMRIHWISNGEGEDGAGALKEQHECIHGLAEINEAVKLLVLLIRSFLSTLVSLVSSASTL